MTRIDKHVAGTVCWADLMTSDAEQARNFYKALFDWTFAIGGPESGYYAMANLGDDHVAGLGPLPPGATFPSAWSVYFAAADLDATAQRIRTNGGIVVMGPMDVMEEGRMAMCVDPTGAAFGVWQPKRHTGAQIVDEPGTMTWREVMTPDPAKAQAFYAKVFGLDAKKLEGDMDYWTLQQGEHFVGGVCKSERAYWRTYFAVADTDAAAARIKELGGTVSTEPFDSPYGRVAFVADPTGAAFAIIKPAR